MGKLSNDFEEHTYHAVFLQDHTKTHLLCRNSWAHYMDPLDIEKSHEAIHSYWSVSIKKFTLKGDEGIGDITILKHHKKYGLQSIYLRKWKGYGTLRCEFDHYLVDTFGR